MRTLSTGAVLLLALAAPAVAQVPAMTAQTDKGPALTDAKGMTLYTFDCYDQCATNWPPLMAPADATAQGAWTTVTRRDGAKQWAYNGKPLYTWIRDQKPGDTTGDGVNNVWKIAKP